MSEAKSHWEKVYEERKPDELSWYQPEPSLSLAMIGRSSLSQDAGIIDVGGGASALVDRLLDLGYHDLCVLDISGRALAYSKERLGDRAAAVQWLEADATRFTPLRSYDLWHDRAVFHFLVDPADRARYIQALNKGLRPGGTLILSAFAPEGPEKCSGLDVCRYEQGAVLAALGPGFKMKELESEAHRTPWDKEQSFNYFRLEKTA